jgi:ABC-type amino acid transport substrate-binding protein
MLALIALVGAQECPGPYSFFYNDPSRGRVYAGLRVGYDASVIAPHPDTNADIVIGTEADFGPFNYIKDGVLGGFDIELTQAVCAAVNKTCAIVTVPWQSVWPKEHAKHNIDAEMQAKKTYPGVAYLSRWFHCSVGTRNMIARQQSVAFTDPYTDKSKDLAGFVTADPAFPANAAGKKAGILSAQGTTIYYYSQAGTKFTADSVEEFDDKAAMYEALKAGIVDAVYGGEVDNEEFLASNSGYSFLHEEGGWTSGFAFACHPEYGRCDDTEPRLGIVQENN